MPRAHTDERMQVPLRDPRLRHASTREDIVTGVRESHVFIMGPDVERLESEVAAAIGVRRDVAVSSGTDAQALGDFPVGDAAASDVLALAIYPKLACDQQRYVVALVAEHAA